LGPIAKDALSFVLGQYPNQWNDAIRELGGPLGQNETAIGQGPRDLIGGPNAELSGWLRGNEMVGTVKVLRMGLTLSRALRKVQPQ